MHSTAEVTDLHSLTTAISGTPHFVILDSNTVAYKCGIVYMICWELW